MGLMGERLGAGFNQLGWHWWPSYAAIATKPHNGRPACINLGPCNTGCAQGAKASTDRTYWPLALQSGVRLKTNARVSEITLNEQGEANGALYFDAGGNIHFQPARLVILACNGVGTPRLLLNSNSPQFPDGLANRSGQVGRNLMLHPLGYVEGVFADDLQAHRGPQGCAVYSHQFYETDRNRDFVRGYTLQALRGPGLIETATSGFLRREIPVGTGFQAALAARYGHTVGLGVIVEDLPEKHNTVTLDADLTDAHGIPAPKINYTLSENSQLMLKHGLDRGKEVMKAAGACKVTGFGPVRHTGWHLMGTARMGHNSLTSVVNAQGRSHDVNNLYIVDSSVFVTSGGVNPVSTMQAIALHIADGIVRARHNSP
jgi:choline dehydrogenase-like flavoprotein